MKKLILFLIFSLGLYQGAFALDIVSVSPSDSLYYTFGLNNWGPGYDQYYVKSNICSSVNVLQTGYTNSTFMAGKMVNYTTYGNIQKIFRPSDFVIFNPLTGWNTFEFFFDTTTCTLSESSSIFGGTIFDYGNGNYSKIVSGNIQIFNVVGGSENILSTIPKPSLNFSVMPGTIPVHFISEGQGFFAYQGTDGNAYQVSDTFASGTDISYGLSNTLPLGTFAYSDMIFANQTVGSGSLYIPYSGLGISLDHSYTLKFFNTFQNPKAYFTTSDNQVVSWDLNCKTQGYNSCRLNGGSFKCTDNAGTLSPGGESCGGTVSVAPPTTSSGSGMVQFCYTGSAMSATGTVYTPLSFPSGYLTGASDSYFKYRSTDFFSKMYGQILLDGSMTSPSQNLNGFGSGGFWISGSGDIIAGSKYNITNWYQPEIHITTEKVGDFSGYFNYLYISGSSTETFTYSYLPDNGFFTQYIDAPGEYNLGNHVFLTPVGSLGIRDVVIHLKNGATYHIDSIEIGQYKQTRIPQQICTVVTQNEIDIAGGTGALRKQYEDTSNLRASKEDNPISDGLSFTSSVKYYLSFLSFSLSENGNQFTVYLPTGHNLAFVPSVLIIPKTGYLRGSYATGVSEYFSTDGVPSGNKDILDYIIFMIGFLIYMFSVYVVVLVLVFGLGKIIFKFLYSVSSDISLGVFGEYDTTSGGNIVSFGLMIGMIVSIFLFIDFLFGKNFLVSIISTLIDFRNILGYLVNYLVLSFTDFQVGSFVSFVNQANSYIVTIVLALITYRTALKF